MLERAVLRAAEPIDPATVLSAERAIVRDRFGDSTPAYRAALVDAQVTLADARAIIADRLGRQRVEERFRPRPPSAASMAAFLATYAATRVRLVTVAPRAPWLGDVDQGLVVETLAPIQVFRLATNRSATIDTIDGRFTVRPLAPALPLFALSRAQAVGVAKNVLDRFARDDVFQSWLRGQEGEAARFRRLCARRPAGGADVDLTAWVPFLGD